MGRGGGETLIEQPVGRVDHLALHVTDLDRRVALFEALGLTLRRMGALSSDPSRRIALLGDAAGFKVELIESSGDAFAHLAMATEDLPAATAAAPALGLQVDRAPYRLAAAKADSAMLSDAAGLVVQLIQYDEDSPDR